MRGSSSPYARGRGEAIRRFAFLALVGLASMFGAEAYGPASTTLLLVVGTLLFVVRDAARTPVLLFIGASIIHAVVVVQAGRTLAQQAAQEPTNRFANR